MERRDGQLDRRAHGPLQVTRRDAAAAGGAFVAALSGILLFGPALVMTAVLSFMAGAIAMAEAVDRREARRERNQRAARTRETWEQFIDDDGRVQFRPRNG